MLKAQKITFVEGLTKELEKAVSVILIDYTGLSVKKQQDLKKRLKAVNANMLVTKNTLFKIAGKNAKLNENVYSDTALAGPVALILSESDPIAPLQVINKFAGEYEMPNFKVGIVDGTFSDTAMLSKLAKLPGKDDLYSQLIGNIASPMYGIVGVLQGNIQKLLYILKNSK